MQPYILLSWEGGGRRKERREGERERGMMGKKGRKEERSFTRKASNFPFLASLLCHLILNDTSCQKNWSQAKFKNSWQFLSVVHGPLHQNWQQLIVKIEGTGAPPMSAVSNRGQWVGRCLHFEKCLMYIVVFLQVRKLLLWTTTRCS